MSESASTSSNVCYRHPKRESYVLCQRCGRTICPECQTQAAVGVQCPECVREGQASVPRVKSPLRAAFSKGSTKPVVTWTIIAVSVVLFALQNIPVIGNYVSSYGAYRPVYTELLPWTMITSIFLHWSILHILFNMYSLFIIGPPLERLLGRGRFIALYLISGFGGSVAVLLLAPASLVAGASGAIFGLLGAFFVIQRRLGGTNVQLLVIVGLNLVIGFIPGLNISWQAHVGGLIAGAAVAFIFTRTRQPGQRNTQILMVSLVAVALVAITVVRLLIHS